MLTFCAWRWKESKGTCTIWCPWHQSQTPYSVEGSFLWNNSLGFKYSQNTKEEKVLLINEVRWTNNTIALISLFSSSQVCVETSWIVNSVHMTQLNMANADQPKHSTVSDRKWSLLYPEMHVDLGLPNTRHVLRCCATATRKSKVHSMAFQQGEGWIQFPSLPYPIK